MEVTYKKDPGHNYMLPVFEVPEREGYVVQMLCENRIPSLLQVSRQRLNGKESIRYEITSLQTIETLFARRGMTGTDVTRVLEGLLQACESAGAYLLNASDIIPEPAFLYMEPESRQVQCCYLPGYDDSELPSNRYLSLAEFMLRHLDHTDQMAVKLGYGFYEAVSRENFSFVQAVKELLPGYSESSTGHSSGQTSHLSEPAGNKMSAQKMDSSLTSGAVRKDGVAHTAMTKHGADGKKVTAGRVPGRGRPADSIEDTAHTSAQERYEDIDDMDESRFAVDEKVFRDPAPSDKKGRRRKRRKEEPKGKIRISKQVKTGILVSVILIVVYVALVFFLRLDLTQMGGLFFLMVAVTWLVYGTVTGKDEKNRNHWAEDVGETIDEEAFILQLMSEVYDTEAADGTQDTGMEPWMNRAVPGGRQDGTFSQGSLPGSGDSSRSMFLKNAAAGGAGYGSTRILRTDLYLPELTLVSENPRYPALKPIGALSLIGKQTDSVDLALPRHDAVSRIHAKLECTEEGIFVTDQNSTNGTFVNDVQIMERTELHEGDKVSFAGISYRVRTHS